MEKKDLIVSFDEKEGSLLLYIQPFLGALDFC